MRPIGILVALCAAMMTFGCAQNMYDGMRLRQEMECEKMQGPQRDECMRRVGMSYDEYQRQLKEREKSR
jgi:hypothetical protein